MYTGKCTLFDNTNFEGSEHLSKLIREGVHSYMMNQTPITTKLLHLFY